MATQIRIMKIDDSGYIDTSGDIAGDLGLADYAPEEVLCGLRDIEPEQEWRIADDRYLGWDIVLESKSGTLLSATEGD